MCSLLALRASPPRLGAPRLASRRHPPASLNAEAAGECVRARFLGRQGVLARLTQCRGRPRHVRGAGLSARRRHLHAARCAGDPDPSSTTWLPALLPTCHGQRPSRTSTSTCSSWAPAWRASRPRTACSPPSSSGPRRPCWCWRRQTTPAAASRPCPGAPTACTSTSARTGSPATGRSTPCATCSTTRCRPCPRTSRRAARCGRRCRFCSSGSPARTGRAACTHIASLAPVSSSRAGHQL